MLLAAALAVCAAGAATVAELSAPVAVLRVHSVGEALGHLGEAAQAEGDRSRVSLGVVFDSTGSMYDDLRRLIRGVEKVLQVVVAADSHRIENFILVPYHDPVIGPAIVTDDYHQFYDNLKTLDVRGGGDCPEMALTGLKLALERALPGSHIYVFTDASAKDYHLLEEILSLISDKSPHIVFVLTGNCEDPDGPGQAVFQRIAAVTSGHVFHMQKDSVQQVLEFVRESLRPGKVSLAAVDHDPAPSEDAEADPPSVPVVNFHVDKSLDEFTVSVSGNRPEVTIRESENQEDVTGDLILDLPKVKVVNIQNPKPGRYTVTVETEDDSPFTMRATAISGVTFEFGFTLDEDGSLSGALDRPVQNETNYLLVRPVNASEALEMRQAELTSLEGQVLRTVDLGEREPDGVFRGGPFVPPDDLFRVKVQGAHEDGSPLQRETSAVSAVQIGKPTLVAPSEVKGHLGANVTIPCRVRSYLPMTAGWFFEYQPFSAFTNYSQSSRSRLLHLNMADVKPTDAGDYICMARNAFGKVFQTVKLLVLAPPPNVTTPRNVTVLEGRPVYLACDVTSSTPYNVTWRRAEWFHSGRALRRPDTTDYLHIPAAALTSAGRYACTAANEGGNVTSETTLEVHSKPKVSINTPGAVFLPQQQVVIICQAYGKPYPEVVWTRGHGTIITPSEDGRVQLEHSILRISNAQASDEDVYSCTGTNPYGSATKSLYIRYAEPPLVRVPNESALASIGDSVTLRCNVTGKPTPTVSWLRSSAPLQTSGQVKVSSGRLHIFSLKSSDAGQYTCAAENEYGRDEGVVTLRIGSPPRATIEDYDVSLPYGGSTSLPCVAVGSPDPEFRWSHDGKQLTKVDSAGALTIEHAGLEDSGRYVCTAINKYGTATLSVNVIVLGIEPPLLMDVSPLVRAARGAPLALPCPVISANPAPTFAWEHDGLPVVSGRGRRLLANGTLLLAAVRRRDGGLYRCTARNAAGSKSLTTQVDVQFSPDIASPDEPALEVTENATVFLACDVSAEPVPRVLWVKHGQLIVPLDSRLWVHANNTLQISSVTEDDTGVYTCHVNNTRGTASARRALVVHAPPRIVSIEADVGPAVEYELERPPPRLERRELDRNGGSVATDEANPALTSMRGDQSPFSVTCDPMT
ncbi:hemicentin-1-like [Pollicipes pollicipes]|uniref:hemicentin-1-like n=1 Tax=Pollicipes pollicipes TaxID=41117 RepID=UPI0018857C31|nr:hemicentin-1-like [Pollicipes pollicipes]